jgi:hypothetical protein
MSTGQAFFAFCRTHGYGAWKVHLARKLECFTLGQADIEALQARGQVFWADRGGLLLGNRHEQGGIHFLQPIAREEYIYVAELEGLEFLSGPVPDGRSFDAFQALNEQGNQLAEQPTDCLRLPAHCPLIDVRGLGLPVVIGSKETQFVFSRRTTTNYLERLLRWHTGQAR